MACSALFVGNFLSGDGKHRHYCEDLADRLEARAWNIVRASRQPGRVRRLADMLATTWSSRRDYDVAHVDVFSGAAFFWAEAVCFELQRLGKPIVLTLRGGNLPEFSRRWPRRTRRLLERAAAITSPSAYLRDALSGHAAVTVLPNAVDVKRYAFRIRTTASPRLVWLRAFHRVYNPVLAVEVLARVRILRHDATLIMVGGDKGDGSLEVTRSRARELGVEPFVTIVDGVPKTEVASYLARGDVFLNTSDIDNSPVTVVEAMAAGLCVVSTNVGGIPYLLRHGEDALLVPPNNAEAMAQAVAGVLAEPTIAARLSAAGREVANGCDWERVLDQWVEVLAKARSHG